MLNDLLTAPEALTRRQWRFVWLAGLFVFIGRLLAVSRSMWDWDEALFSHAVREYDVASHLPHPPGFPAFIAFAKVVNLFVASEFRSLQVITVAGSLALYPVMLFLCRELRLPFRTSFVASLLVVHFPNVWFFGGGAFSDVPSLALVLLACALLLQGCRSGRSYLAGALVLAIAAGFRPQNLLVGFAPAVIATWCRIRSTRSLREVILATVLGTTTIAAAYGGAALATGGWTRYDGAVTAHREYIRSVDSFANQARPDLLSLFDDFFVRPYRAPRLNFVISVLAGFGLLWGVVRRRASILLALSIFAPFSTAGWLMLDYYSASRFSVAWAPLIAIAASFGIATLAEGLARVLAMRTVRLIEGLTVAALVVVMIEWTIPALNQVRRSVSPPIQAIDWIRLNVPAGARIDVHGSMLPFSRFLLGDYDRLSFDERGPARVGAGWLLREGASHQPGAHTFSYRRNNLWNIARRRYFDVSVVPQRRFAVRFVDGWYDEESSDAEAWRWMRYRSRTSLAPTSGEAELTLRMHLPLDAMPAPPTISILFNGNLLERFTPASNNFERSYVVPSRIGATNELVIETNRVVNPARQGLGVDERDLGLRLDELKWNLR